MQATVIKADQHFVTLQFSKPKCANCREDNHCLTITRMWQKQQPDNLLEIKQTNPPLVLGQQLDVPWSAREMLKAQCVLYGLPLLGVLLGACIAQSLAFNDTQVLLSCLVLFTGGVMLAKKLSGLVKSNVL